jgi:ubiquinone/menaquinone biosynthesis methyltransferase
MQWALRNSEFRSICNLHFTIFNLQFPQSAMPNSYYEAGQQRAARVEDLFGAIAPRYDLINDLQSFGLHRWWKRRLVRLAGVKPGDRALDLCCGTGDVALAFAAAGIQTTGLDFSEPMLAVARERQTRQPERGSPEPQHARQCGGAAALESRAPIQFLRGDALHLPFPEAQFDAVTISYGLRNLADFDAGLREMWRVAKPGGRLLVLDFGKPDNAAWRWLYFQHLRWLVPVFGRIFCRNSAAYAYIHESLMHYPAQRGVADKMRELGCADVRIHNLLGGVMSINYGVKAG